MLSSRWARPVTKTPKCGPDGWLSGAGHQASPGAGPDGFEIVFHNFLFKTLQKWWKIRVFTSFSMSFSNSRSLFLDVLRGHPHGLPHILIWCPGTFTNLPDFFSPHHLVGGPCALPSAPPGKPRNGPRTGYLSSASCDQLRLPH